MAIDDPPSVAPDDNVPMSEVTYEEGTTKEPPPSQSQSITTITTTTKTETLESSTPLPTESPLQTPIKDSSPDEQADDSEAGIIRCICGFATDDGYTIQCDKCYVWQHLVCVAISPSQVPENYLCDQCEPRPLDIKRAIEVQSRKQKSGRGRGRRPSMGGPGRPRSKVPSPLMSRGGARGGRGGRPMKSPRNNSALEADVDMSDSEMDGDIDHPYQLEYNAIDVNFVSPTAIDYLQHLDLPETVPPLPFNRKRSRSVANQEDSQMSPEKSVSSARLRPNDIVGLDKAVVKTPPLKTSVKRLPIPKGCAMPALRYGIFADQSIPRECFLFEFRGELTTKDDYIRDPINQFDIIGATKPFVAFHPRYNLCIDARRFGNEARFLRRSCRPSVAIRSVRVGDSPSPLSLGVFALRDISKGEELTLGWGWSKDHVAASIRRILKGEEAELGSDDESCLRRKQASSALSAILGLSECACDSRTECLLVKMQKLADGKSVNGKGSGKLRKKDLKIAIQAKRGVGRPRKVQPEGHSDDGSDSDAAKEPPMSAREERKIRQALEQFKKLERKGRNHDRKLSGDTDGASPKRRRLSSTSLQRDDSGNVSDANTSVTEVMSETDSDIKSTTSALGHSWPCKKKWQRDFIKQAVSPAPTIKEEPEPEEPPARTNEQAELNSIFDVQIAEAKAAKHFGALIPEDDVLAETKMDLTVETITEATEKAETEPVPAPALESIEAPPPPTPEPVKVTKLSFAEYKKLRESVTPSTLTPTSVLPASGLTTPSVETPFVQTPSLTTPSLATPSLATPSVNAGGGAQQQDYFGPNAISTMAATSAMSAASAITPSPSPGFKSPSISSPSGYAFKPLAPPPPPPPPPAAAQPQPVPPQKPYELPFRSPAMPESPFRSQAPPEPPFRSPSLPDTFSRSSAPLSPGIASRPLQGPGLPIGRRPPYSSTAPRGPKAGFIPQPPNRASPVRPSGSPYPGGFRPEYRPDNRSDARGPDPYPRPADNYNAYEVASPTPPGVNARDWRDSSMSGYVPPRRHSGPTPGWRDPERDWERDRERDLHRERERERERERDRERR